MHGTVPIARTVAAAISQQPSRIPHIHFHILQRRTNCLQPRQPSRIRVNQPRRLHSTTAHPETSYHSTRAYDDEQENVDAAVQTEWRPFREAESSTGLKRERAHGVTSQLPTASDADLDGVNLYTFLEQGDANFLPLAIVSETIGTPFLRHALDEDFDKAVLMLDPSRMIEPIIATYHHRPGIVQSAVKARGVGDISHSLNYCRALLRHMIQIRHAAGRPLTLTTYRHLMRWAASLRDLDFALEVEQYMLQDKVVPDLDCHNHFLEAKVWNNTASPREKMKLRVYEYNLRARGFNPRTEAQHKTHKGHGIAVPKDGILGLRQEVLLRFQRMLQAKLVPNEATFINIMTAMSREGDVEGVHSILKSVWNIDMAQLEMYGEDEIQAPTFYEVGSHLRPSQRLLFAIAHIFGSNNDAHTAWTLLDYVSRSYDLTISQDTWRELLNWHLVLSCDRTLTDKGNRGENVGYIKPFVFEQLFAAMLDKPYNIPPDAAMLYMLSRVRKTERRFTKSLEALEMLRAIWQQTSIQLKDVVVRLRQELSEMSRERNKSLWHRTSLMELRQEFLDLSLTWDCSLRMLQQAVTQHVLRSRSWETSPGSQLPRNWEYRWIPAIVQEYLPFLRGTLTYVTRTGHVALRDPEVKSQTAVRFSPESIEGSPFDQEVCRIRMHLKATNSRVLFENMKKLHMEKHERLWHDDLDDDLSTVEASMLRKLSIRFFRSKAVRQSPVLRDKTRREELLKARNLI